MPLPHVQQNQPWYIRNLSHAVWSSIFIILVDIIINVILFIINRPSYNTVCINDAANRMGRSVQAAFPNGTSVNLNFTTNSDFYNCDKMWQDELKFSILSIIVIFVLYVSLRYIKKQHLCLFAYLASFGYFY
jgi:hypothetical protein